MTKQELRKEFEAKWKNENQTKYVVWLICYIADLIPLSIMIVQMIGPMNDEKAGTIFVCIAAVIVLSVISMVINLGKNKEWKQYLEANRNRVK